MHWKSENTLEISWGCKKYTITKKVSFTEGTKSKSCFFILIMYMFIVIHIMIEMTERIIGKIPTKSTLT